MAPTGIVPAWGYSMNNIANGFTKGIDPHGYPLTYQESISSTPVNLANGVNFNSFGKINKGICQMFLQNKSINPTTGRKIKKNGPVYLKLIKLCEENNIFVGKKPPLPKW